ncbi:MAG: hypothetical protein ACXAD7_18465 [Candidatus Kariarchaeaceae archaeon]|jgi:hypothetical protein
MVEKDSILVETFKSVDEATGRPIVQIDGKYIEHKRKTKKIKIEGKTIDVYYFLIRNEGYHGVREIQRTMGYSSPNLARYHLNKLIDAGIITKNVHGQYGIEKDEVKLGSMEEHVKFLEYWIPRTFIFGGMVMLLGIFGLLYRILGINGTLFYWVFLFTCFAISFLLIYDGIKMLGKYHMEDERKS